MTKFSLGSFKNKLSRSPSADKSPNFSQRNTSSANSKMTPTKQSRENQADSSPPVSDLPPPYTVSPGAAPASSPRPASSGTNAQDNNPYAFLANYDTIFLIDDSSSMSIGSRWREAEAAISAITPICTSHDSDGIDIYFLNHRTSQSTPSGKADGGYYGVTSPSTVSQIFSQARPCGATPTGTRLRQILKPYMNTLDRAADADSVKPINIIVITDGAATDEPEEILHSAATRLDRIDAAPSQVGVQFFQIGEDEAAAEALRYLDDDLKKRGVRDMVDTCTWNDAKAAGRGKKLTSDVILKVVLGAVLRRLDNQPAKGRKRGGA